MYICILIPIYLLLNHLKSKNPVSTGFVALEDDRSSRPPRLCDALSQNQQSDFPVSPADKRVTAVTDAAPAEAASHYCCHDKDTHRVSRVLKERKPQATSQVSDSLMARHPQFHRTEMFGGLQHFIQDKCFLAFGNLTSCYGSTLLRHLET